MKTVILVVEGGETLSTQELNTYDIVVRDGKVIKDRHGEAPKILGKS